jgi:hypothetical protein
MPAASGSSPVVLRIGWFESTDMIRRMAHNRPGKQWVRIPIQFGTARLARKRGWTAA